MLKGFSSTIHILNIYGPYSKRKCYLDQLVASGILSDPTLIVVGDLNFTTSPSEFWGAGNIMDPLPEYFLDIF